jgi:hypothetical protein
MGDTVHGDRRSFSLLRWIAKREAQDRLEALMLDAYQKNQPYGGGDTH